MRHFITIALGLALAALASAQQPLYQPGSVQSEDGLRAPLDPPEQAEDEHHWQVESDITLYHDQLGYGRRLLVVHGGPGFHFAETPTGLERLADAEYEVIWYDQRGAGRSSKPFDSFETSNFFENAPILEKALGLGAQIADLERIRRILGEDQLILVGHSFGAFIATMYAAEFPEHVEALVLVAPADMLVMPQPDGGLFPLIRSRLTENTQSEFDNFLGTYFNFGTLFSQSEATLADMNREFGKYFMIAAGESNEDIERITQLYTDGRANAGWGVYATYFSLGMQHDYLDFVSGVEAPALVVHAADDLQPQSVADAYVDALPNAELYVIEDSGHAVFDDRPETFANIVDEFLSGFQN